MLEGKLVVEAGVLKAPKYYEIYVKHSDMGTFRLLDVSRKVVEEVEGYAPHTSIGGGDYTQLTIENDTGKIVGWQPVQTLKSE